jgi:transposase
MISGETIAALEQRGLLYLLGVRERTDKLVRDVVLNDAAPFVPLTIEKRGKQTDYSAKSVTLAGTRYIVCVKRGDKALVGNTGYRRFLWTVGDGHFAIDRAKAEEDARFDGVFVLRTNSELTPLAARLRYKQLWTVEQTFRTAKHLLATRPIFHKLDETIRGHVFCSFLGLVLKAEMEARIKQLGQKGSGDVTLDKPAP